MFCLLTFLVQETSVNSVASVHDCHWLIYNIILFVKVVWWVHIACYVLFVELATEPDCC